MPKARLLQPLVALLTMCFSFFYTPASSQMRQVYLDPLQPQNELKKISFYTAAEGYVAFRDWIGYTTDTGRTFTKKYITLNNVNYNGYNVNLTFGFGIAGVHAFTQNTLVAYGDYGLVPAILRSTNGGTSWTLVFHSQFNPLQVNGGIKDLVFPSNGSTGYAVEPNRILKSTDQGLNWIVSRTDALSFYSRLEAVDINNLVAVCTEFNGSKMLKTTNAGTSWTQVTLPQPSGGWLAGAFFLTPTNGWLCMYGSGSSNYIYKTTNSGSSWTLLNNPDITPFASPKLRFVDNNTGYGLYDQNTVYKTLNGGATWEPLPRDNNEAYLGFSHNDLVLWSPTQLWAGGSNLLELSTNSGGTPLPKAYFKVDTIGLYNTGNVTLTNFSRTGYTYKWLVNRTLVSTQYNASYQHNPNSTLDTIALIVNNGTNSDTATKYQAFYPSVIVSSFTPTIAATGNTVNIYGSNFTGATAVYFGGTPASSFTVVSNTNIRATVGSGASGNVTVATATGQGSIAGFTYTSGPIITSFTPTSAIAGTTISINGSNFTTASTVSFGGVVATSFTVVSPSLITAVVPSGGSGSVVITTPGGTSSLAGYIALPTIASFTPLSGTQGTVMTISGTSLTGVTAVTIGGVATQSFTVNSSTTITAVVNAGATGSVMVSKTGGSSTLSGFTWYSPPVISSFSPTSGPVGTTVTINGTGFNAIPVNNTVYFGAVQAQVVSSTTTSVVVTVPTGTTFDPISITNNNLVAYSQYPFLLTFPNGGAISATSFASPVVMTSPNDGMMDIRIGDLDGDGKPDLAVSHYNTQNATQGGVFLYRNTSTLSTTSFATPINITTGSYDNIALGDLDGDGKQDLTVITNEAQSLSFYRNTSGIGSFSFATPVVVNGAGTTSGFGFRGLTIGDVNGDGKADVLASIFQYPNYKAAVLRNISNLGTIAFAPLSMFDIDGGRNVLLTDMDGDTKPDMVFPASVYNNFFILKNTSSVTNISFAPASIFPGYSHSYMAYGDMDGDGKTDLVSSDNNGSRVAIFRNTSNSSGFSFSPVVQYDATSNPGGIGVSDLDGDGKLDIAIRLSNTSLGVYKNFSTAGVISFAPKIEYAPVSTYGGEPLAIGDVNGDGKNDIITISETQRGVRVHVNKVVPEPYIQSFTPTIGATGTAVTITGGNFTGVTAVAFGNVAAASFTVNSPNSIVAIVGGGASGAVTVTNSYGTGSRPGFSFGIPPVITSIAPLTGPVGSNVVITGSNFSTATTGNIVYFGTVRATVTAATTTSLTVTVPTGPTLQPFTITTNNLTAYSSQLFSVTFPGAGSSFSTSNFAARTIAPVGGKGGLCDIDGDGKLDLVMGGNTSNSMFVYRNTSTAGSVSYTNLPTVIGSPDIDGFAFGDLDGDGKQDVAAYNFNSNSFSVIRNTSTPGNISMQQVFNNLTGPSTTNPLDIAISDLDGDGKPDIVVGNYYSRTVSIFKNVTFNGSINFGLRIDYGTGGYVTGVTLRDVNGDGKPDIVVSLEGAGSAALFTNNSIPGTIAFGNIAVFASAPGTHDVAAADLDNDGIMDILTANYSSSTLSVFRNISTPTSTAMAPRQDFTTGAGAWNVSVGDLDGDGKVDVVTSNYSVDNEGISLFKNGSSAGTITLQPKFDISIPGSNYMNSIGDIDGDGLPDIVVYCNGTSGNYILRNLTGTATTVATCAGGNTTLTSSITGSSYQWQQNTGTGFVNIVNNSNFSGATTATLQITGILATWNNYEYRCTVNSTQTSTVSRLNVNVPVVPSVMIATPATSICSGTLATFTATPTNGGAMPTYQWQVNGTNVGTNNPVFTTATLANNSQVSVVMTSSAACAVPTTVTSNTIAMTVNPSVTPSATIATPTTSICAGSSASFTATPINGGTSPTYQWQINGANVGVNSPTFTSSAITNGSQVRVTMTGNAACATTPNPVVSNTISMSTSSAVLPAISISVTDSNICSGNTATFTATPVNGGATPAYQWQVNGINAGNNNSIFTSNTLTDNNQVKVIMTSSLACASPATATSNTVTMHISPIVVPAVTIAASAISICAGTIITFTATPTNGGTNPIYQWKRNGLVVGTANPIYTATALSNGDIITVILTSSARCATPAIATSNSITMAVISQPPAISISGDTLVNSGAIVTVTATVANSNTAPTYQWQDSTTSHTWATITGATNASISYAPAATGSKIRCLLFNASTCSAASATSNVLRFTLNQLGTGGRIVVNYHPNPATNMLTIDSLKLTDRWETLTITGMYGGAALITRNIAGQTRIDVPVTMLPSGIYVAVLRRSKGSPVLFKFVKL